MPPDKKFELGDYIEVKDRIAIFYELYPQGRLVTANVRWPGANDDTPRIAVQALAYRTPDDPQPGVGWSWMALPGTTPYTKGSELENTETSAWGRAIASLGILIDRSIASAQEVANKAGDAPERPRMAETAPSATTTHDGSLVGVAEVGKAGSGADFALRQSPEGPVTAFRLKQGRTGIKVIAHGAAAIAIAAQPPTGQRIQVWGSVREETFGKGGRDISYNVVDLERIKTDDFDWPAQEAPSLPLPLDDEERAAIAGSLP